MLKFGSLETLEFSISIKSWKHEKTRQIKIYTTHFQRNIADHFRVAITLSRKKNIKKKNIIKTEFHYMNIHWQGLQKLNNEPDIQGKTRFPAMLMGWCHRQSGLNWALKLLNKSEVLHTTHVQWSYYSDPCGFTQAQCEILSPVCDHLMHGSGLLISRKVCFLNNTSLP